MKNREIISHIFQRVRTDTSVLTKFIYDLFRHDRKAFQKAHPSDRFLVAVYSHGTHTSRIPNSNAESIWEYYDREESRFFLVENVSNRLSEPYGDVYELTRQEARETFFGEAHVRA